MTRNRLDAPHLGQGSRLNRFIAARARQRGLNPPLPQRDGIFWGADWWGLDKWSPFVAADPAVQTAVLRDLTRHVLNEAYFIEKSGSAYASKMMVLAEDTDTAQLYGLIAGDEAVHLSWVEPFVAEADKVAPEGEFLRFLSALIEDAPPRVLVVLVQIILEGWGLDHYRRLSVGCLDPELAAVWGLILKDEALHHQSGVAQFEAARLTPEERTQIEQGFRHYAQMVAAGPVGAVSVVARHMTTDAGLMVALGHPVETQRKLDLLAALMRQPGLENLCDHMRAEGCFHL